MCNVTMTDSVEQRVCAIRNNRNTLEEKLKRSRERFEAERTLDAVDGDIWFFSDCAGLWEKNVEERDHKGRVLGNVLNN